MAISNTSILVKRSSTTATPGSLKAGEIAYSYSSNNFFIGSPTGDGVVAIGGLNTFNTVNNATNANTASTLVKRDANGAFYGRIFGVANTAVALDTSQNFSITGGDISASAVGFNGTSAVTLSASLNAVPGLSGGTVGSSTSVPVIQYGANGRILSVSSQTIATSFNISDGTTSNTINGGATFYQKGTGGITTTVTPNTVTISTDTTIARTNTTSVGPQTFSTDINLPTNNMSIGGVLNVSNMYVSGNIYQTNATQTLNIGDPIIYLAANNNSNVVDLGFVGHFVGTGHTGDTSHYQHTGFVRDYNDNKWKLFSNVSTEPTTTVNFGEANTVYDVIKVGGIDVSSGAITAAGSIAAGSLTLTTPLGISSGGTNGSTFTNNQITYFNGTSIVSLANTGTAGTYGSPSYTQVITTDSFGRVSSVSNNQIAIDASQVISGTFPIARGGTNSASYAQNGLLYYNGTSFLTSANQTAYTTQGGASYVPVISTNALGQVTAISNTQIQIDAATNIVSGTLPLTRGGTGATSFTNGQIVIGNGTTSLISLANSSYSNTGTYGTNTTLAGLTIDAYGRVTAAAWQAISGLTVSQGGTGFASATTNGITYGNGTGALGVTAAAGTSDQAYSNEILTVTNAGVPVWSSALDGGVF